MTKKDLTALSKEELQRHIERLKLSMEAADAQIARLRKAEEDYLKMRDTLHYATILLEQKEQEEESSQ